MKHSFMEDRLKQQQKKFLLDLDADLFSSIQSIKVFDSFVCLFFVIC